MTTRSSPTSDAATTERRSSPRDEPGGPEKRHEDRNGDATLPQGARLETPASPRASRRPRVIYRPQGTTSPQGTSGPRSRPPETKRPVPAGAEAKAADTKAADTKAAEATTAPAVGRRSVVVTAGVPRGSVAATAAALSVAEAAPEPDHSGEHHHLRLVEREPRTPQERRRRRRLLLASTVSVTLAVVFALVYLHVMLAEHQFELNRLQAEQARAQAIYQQRRLAVSELAAPSRIISIAEARLGMVQPGSVTYLHAPTTSTSTSSTATAKAGTGHAGPGTPAASADWFRMKPLLAGSP